MTELNGMFFLSFLYFLFASFITFYIPGSVLLKRYHLTPFQHTILAFLLGMNLWAWQGFVLGYLNLRFLSYLYVIGFGAFWIWKKEYRELFDLKKNVHIKNNKRILLIITIGSLLQILMVWFMGVKLSHGVVFCCLQYTDSMLEIAIVREIVHRFPPYEPGLYGVTIQNYHYWGHIVIAELVRVYGLPIVATTYQFMSLFIAILLGFSAIVFSQLLKLPKKYILWLLFFLYFGGDATYTVMLLLRHQFSLSVSGLESGMIFLMNYPRAFAVDMFFGGLAMMALWFRKKDLFTGFIVSLIIASLVGFKVYVGIFADCGLLFLGLYFLYKREWKQFIPICIAGILAAIIYLPVNHNAGGLFYTGFWRLEDFMVQKQLHSQMVLALQVYQQHHNILRIIEYECIFAFLYFLGMFGTKLFGLFQSKRSLRLLPLPFHIFLISAMVVSLFLGLFFQQNSGGANTFNFLVNVFIIGSIYTALACWYWFNTLKKPLQYCALAIVILLTIPRIIAQIQYLTQTLSHATPQISNAELSALDFLRTQTPVSSLVMTDPNLSLNEISPYVNFLADRSLFMAGKVNELEAHTVPFTKQQKIESVVFTDKNPKKVAQELHTNHISYLYLLPTTKLGISFQQPFLKPVFKNHAISIFQIL